MAGIDATALGIAAAFILFLFLNPWVRLVVFGLGAIASIFSMIASIIHFQILAAMGFLFLAGVCILFANLSNPS